LAALAGCHISKSKKMLKKENRMVWFGFESQDAIPFKIVGCLRNFEF